MAGNAWEWTTEAGNHSISETNIEQDNIASAQYAVTCGGGFDHTGIEHTVSFRRGNQHILDSTMDVGFRVVLYIR